MRHLCLLVVCSLAAPLAVMAAARQLSVLVIDGMNNHDWQAGTRAIESILTGTGRFRVDVCTYPRKPVFTGYDVVVNNFNGGHTKDGTRWPRETEQALESFIRNGGGLVVFHAANNAFLEWPAYNDMIGLGWRDKSFGAGLAIVDGRVVTIPKGSGLDPGHGPRHDFEMFVLDRDHPITRGLPEHWTHPSEQLTHGQHGPAEGLTVLTYAFSEVSKHGEPMDWVRQYGKGRVYVTMLGHTWKDEPNPNLDDVNFQALLARGTEWAATGAVTLPPDLGWKPLFNGKNLDGWEVRGDSVWAVMDNGVLIGQRTRAQFPASGPFDRQTFNAWRYRQAWLYTTHNFHEYDLHVDYWIPKGGNSGVSIRDISRAHYAIGEPDNVHPELAVRTRSTPAHVGYEIQIADEDQSNPSGSIYSLVAAKRGVEHPLAWNSLDIESRDKLIRVSLNGQVVAEGPGDPARPKAGPIGLQLHDQFSFAMFRNIRMRERGK